MLIIKPSLQSAVRPYSWLADQQAISQRVLKSSKKLKIKIQFLLLHFMKLLRFNLWLTLGWAHTQLNGVTLGVITTGVMMIRVECVWVLFLGRVFVLAMWFFVWWSDLCVILLHTLRRFSNGIRYGAKYNLGIGETNANLLLFF